MSPNTKPTIKELDGLPAGEIDLRITQAENRTVKAMEDKLDEHRDAIEKRLDSQDDRLESVQTTLGALAGANGLPGLVQGIKASLDASVVNQNAWHESDLDYRSEVKSRLGSLEDNTAKLGEQVRMIRWFVATSNLTSKCLAKLLEGLRTESFWKIFGFAGVLWFCSHYLPKVFVLINKLFSFAPK